MCGVCVCLCVRACGCVCVKDVEEEGSSDGGISERQAQIR